MARRKKPQEETFETADGFQIEDMEGNLIEDEPLEDDALLAEENDSFWDEEEDEEEQEEDEYFNSVAEENNWEEGYDY